MRVGDLQPILNSFPLYSNIVETPPKRLFLDFAWGSLVNNRNFLFFMRSLRATGNQARVLFLIDPRAHP